MSLFKKIVVVALVVACSQSVTSPANAANPLEKFFTNASKKVVGGAYGAVQKNVTQTSKLVLRTAPYALLQGSRSGPSRNKSFQTSAQKNVTQGNVIKSFGASKLSSPSQYRPTGKSGSYGRPIFFGMRRR
ncbi:hypothetical protein [Rhodopirellula sp. MGV]|uniref:hypothetical protein n=1 Tax=Rhodopirellula sp. MGV TaxID=2023130 RepID=UPI00117ACD8D|nr:hypothetical protein [Rhodopirellula sp. MGV]